MKLSVQALKKWVLRPNTLRDEKAKSEDCVGLAGSAKERRHGELHQLVFAMIPA